MAIPLGSGVAIFVCNEPLGTAENGSNLLDASVYLSLQWRVSIDDALNIDDTYIS